MVPPHGLGVPSHGSASKVAVQMNDTHPTIAVAEMMRLLVAGTAVQLGFHGGALPTEFRAFIPIEIP